MNDDEDEDDETGDIAKSKEIGLQFLALHLISFVLWKYISSCLFSFFDKKQLHNYIYINRDALIEKMWGWLEEILA